MLVDDAAELDRTLLLGQILGGKDADDIDMTPRRDELDSALAEPIGREAEAMNRLLAYLKG